MTTSDNYKKSEAASLSENATMQILPVTVKNGLTFETKFCDIYAVFSSETTLQRRVKTTRSIWTEHVEITYQL